MQYTIEIIEKLISEKEKNFKIEISKLKEMLEELKTMEKQNENIQ
jgi:hypothetical protein